MSDKSKSKNERLPMPSITKLRASGALAPGEVLLRRDWDGALIAADEAPTIASEKRRRKAKSEGSK